MRIFIEPYKNGSQSAKALARALNAKRIKTEGSRFRWKPTRVVVNWGRAISGRWFDVAGEKLNNLNQTNKMLNWPGRVNVASNKLTTFSAIKEWNTEYPNEQVNIPEYTTDFTVAQSWVKPDRLICSRSYLRSHSGKGMVIQKDPVESVIGAPTKLFVRYIRGREFRVHIFNGKVIDVQWKRKRRGTNVDPLIRTYPNGWVFTRGTLSEVQGLDKIQNCAILAVKALGLDFGAVDIKYNAEKDKAYCIEINTAPGISGSTLESYTRAIKEYVNTL